MLKKYSRAACMALLLSMALPFPAMAAEAEERSGDVHKLQPVIVTATRSEHDIQEVPLAVSIVTGEDISRNPNTNIADLLSNVPGVQLGGVNVAGDRRVLIRGQAAGATLILINGVRQPEIRNTAGAGFTISTHDIERIEVIKGPASVLYGSDAVGGVVNIITKKGGDKPVGAKVGVVYDSSVDSWEPSASLFGNYKGFNYRLLADGVNADDRKVGRRGDDESDILFNSNFRQRDYRGQLGYEWEKGSVSFIAERFEGKYNYTPLMDNPNGDGTDIPAPPNKRATISEVPKDDRNSYTLNLHLKDISKNFVNFRATGYLQDLDKGFDYYNYTTGIYSGKHTYEHEAFGGMLQTDWLLFDDHFVSVGLDYDNITMTKRDYLAAGNQQSEGYNRVLAAFIQDEWTIIDGLTLTAGLRQTWNDSALTKDTKTPSNEDDSSDSKLVGSVGLVYTGFEGIALRALFSQGYKLPTLTDMYVGSAVIEPNPDLKPEKSDNYEIGVRYNDYGLNVDLAAYYSKFKNGIARKTVSTSPTKYRPENLTKAVSYGLELQADYQVGQTGFTPYLTGNLLRYQTEDANGFKTYHSSRSPAWGSLGVKWEQDVLNGAVLFTDLNVQAGKGAYTEEPNGNEHHRTKGWYTANWSVGLEGPVEYKYKVALSVRNLFDEYYQIASPYLASNPIPEPGMHAVINFEYEF